MLLHDDGRLRQRRFEHDAKSDVPALVVQGIARQVPHRLDILKVSASSPLLLLLN